jgi:hypothetical protein
MGSRDLILDLLVRRAGQQCLDKMTNLGYNTIVPLFLSPRPARFATRTALLYAGPGG